MATEIKPYIRKVHYYETDQMGVVHHSNYIRWFEEARVDLMDQAGYGYDEMERQGIMSPVLEVTCSYRSMVKFGETVRIAAVIRQFTGSRMTVGYRGEDVTTGTLRTIGESRHCFLKGGRAISIKRENSAVYRMFAEIAESDERKGR